MTIIYAGNGLYTGLSSDTKSSTAPVGYRFYETDTGDSFISDGKYWWIASIPSPFSQKKVGYLPYGASGTAGFGLLNSMTAATNPGSQTFANDTTNGRYLTCISGTSTGNKGGLRVNSAILLRQWNPRMRIRFQLVSTTLMRVYIGFIGGGPTEPAGDDPYGAGASGLTFGCISGATNFQLLHNDSSGATVVDDTGVAIDTALHTLSIVADEAAASNKFAYKLDSGSYVNVTADIPSSVNSLTMCYQNETNESGVAKSFRVFNAFLQVDK